MEYVAGLALFEISVVLYRLLNKKTREPSSSAVDGRTVDLDVVV